MGTRRDSRWCEHCHARVLSVQDTPRHVLHMILSVATFGIWLPAWILATITGAGNVHRCTRCGQETRAIAEAR